ncbi:MAG: LCP family protein [Clostridia bacterium]
MNSTQNTLRWKRVLLGLLLALLFVGLFVFTAAYTFLDGLGPGVEEEEALVAMEIPEPEPDSRIHVLILGLDDPQEKNGSGNPTRSDTMVLGTFDPLTGESNLLFIPRDTRVNIPERPYPEKINHAHAYGGVGRSIETVKEFLNIPIHYYVRVDFEAFREVIDVVGGVTIDVEKDMNYEDPTQDLHIDISAGTQRMDGETALKYVRYRGKDGSDIDRIDRQQKFLRSLLQELLKVDSVVRIPALAERVATNVDTNMKPARIVSLAKTMASVSLDDVSMEKVPGEAGYIDGISYWIPDETAIEELVEREILGISLDDRDSPEIAVYNGGGIPGAAEDVSERIEDLGYQVVHVGQAPDVGDSRYETTKVVSGTEGISDKVFVRTLKIVLGENSEVALYRENCERLDEAERLPGDLQVYVGADYEGIAR